MNYPIEQFTLSVLTLLVSTRNVFNIPCIYYTHYGFSAVHIIGIHKRSLIIANINVGLQYLDNDDSTSYIN